MPAKNQIVNYTELMQRSIEATLRKQRAFVNVFGEVVKAPDGLNFEGLMRGDYHANDGSQINIEQYAWMLANARPHLWANMNLKDPDTMSAYEFWNYQLESVNYRQGDVVHKDGAEVGKTREIITLLLWSASTLHNLELQDAMGNPIRRVQSFIYAPLQGHLADISNAIEEQIELNPHLKSMCKKGWLKKAPYISMNFTHTDGRAVFDFRPAGINGAAFRGIHANAWILGDEVALLKNQKHWTEVERGRKPTGQWRVYSVPDGDRDCEFYRWASNAMPFDEFKRRFPNGVPKGQNAPRILFNWDKTQMPDPFWSEMRRRQFIKNFDGEDSPGYQQNVLGRDGDRANAVFPFSTLKPCLADIQEFRRLKIVANKSKRSIGIELCSFEMVGDCEGRELLLFEREEYIDAWDSAEEWRSIAERLVFEAFGHIRGGIHWAGCDLGLSQDPSEILIAEERGDMLRRHSRLHMKGVDYHIQEEFIRAIDVWIDPQAERNCWGVDQGNAGVAVIGHLYTEARYLERDFESRMMGIMFGSAFDAVDLDGQSALDRKTDKPMRVNGKELGSDLLSLAMQKRKSQYPLDPEMVQIYTSQVFTVGQRWRSFKNKNDHLVDADRTLIMNKVLNDSAGGHDAFSCGSHQR